MIPVKKCLYFILLYDQGSLYIYKTQSNFTLHDIFLKTLNLAQANIFTVLSLNGTNFLHRMFNLTVSRFVMSQDLFHSIFL